uniref:Uncharacterized protein n=1 Tax=Electrophorus electricus TaxID=8005 RepID=A0AAY5EWR1_ELEEL
AFVRLFFFFFLLHQTISRTTKSKFILFLVLNNILFMWPILYFLILFISYCSVQYSSSSIYRYILHLLCFKTLIVNCKFSAYDLIFFVFIFFFQLLKIPNLGTFDTIL